MELEHEFVGFSHCMRCARTAKDALDAELTRLRALIERQAAIIDRLPKTADGVAVVPGMTLYLMPDKEGATNYDMMELKVEAASDYCWYSTRSAAEAAKGGEHV